jgi:hypothetical protein
MLLKHLAKRLVVLMACSAAAASQEGPARPAWPGRGQCGGSPPFWEVAIRPHDSKTIEVFRIGGTRATELRMLAVTDGVTQSCVPEDISKGTRLR